MSDLPTWIDIIIQAGPIIIKGIQRIRNRYKWRGISKDAREIALAIHSFSWTNLQQQLPTIIKIGEIDRPEIALIQNIWQSTDTPILLHGEAGSGKSGIAIRLGKRLSEGGMPVLFIRATEFSPDQDPITILQTRMAIKYPLIEALSKLSKEKLFAIILDQLDSVSETDLSKNFVGFLKSIAGIPNIKILAITRSYELQHDPDISSLGFQQEEIGRFSDEQSINFLSQLGIDNPSQVLIDLSNNLLNLSLIAEVIKESTLASNSLLDEVDLWEQFYNSIKLREGEEVAEDALRIACETALKGERIFSTTFLNNHSRKKLLSRGIIFEASGRRFRFRHEKLQDFLCAYSLLPNQLTFPQLINKANKDSVKGILIWLHLLYHKECPELEPQFVDDVLGAKKELPFYSRITILENLKRQDKPSENVAKVLGKCSDDLAYYPFFFNDLENPAWIIPLYKTGFFYHPPDPIEVQPGYFQIPLWPAGEYLARFAEQNEAIITDVIQCANTENWRAQEIYIDAMLKIPPAVTSKLVSFIDPWLNDRFSGMLPIKLQSLSDHLLKYGFVESAIQILEFIITPVLPPVIGEYSKYLSNVRFRSEHYWVNEYCEKELSKLLSVQPMAVVSVFQRALEKTIEFAKSNSENAELTVGYYWRFDIPSRHSDRSEADALDILIDGFRDGLDEVCKQSIENGKELLTIYLNSQHLLFQRIAIYILRKYGVNYSDLINQVLLHREYLEQSEFSYEYRGLLRDQFSTASNEVREQVTLWILSGSQDLGSKARWGDSEPSEEERKKDQEQWILGHLELIRDYLSGNALNRLDELVQIYGKPDITEHPRFEISSFDIEVSPVPVEELKEKSFDELKLLLLSYIPEDSFHSSRESLARTFQELVQNDLDRYRSFAPYLLDSGIRFVYISHFLSGIKEAIKSHCGKLDDEIIDLCEYAISRQNDPFSAGGYEFSVQGAQMEVADLLGDALQAKEPYLSRGQLDRIRSILLKIVHSPDPNPADEMKSNMDPFTQSMNCVRGKAMHGIIHYSLYLCRERDKLQGEKEKTGFLEPEMQQVLEEKLNLSQEPSLAVHAVYGAYLTQLYYISKEWLEEHIAAIFPEDKEKTDYWLAAWNAYLVASRVYSDVFKMLIPYYQKGISCLIEKEERKVLSIDPKEHLAQHILLSYLWEITDFGDSSNLLDSFFSSAPNSVRSHGIFWLSKVLENEKPASGDTLWQKCWTLWQRRLSIAETQDTSINNQEISEYMRWLKIVPVGMEVLYPTLCSTVKYLFNGYEAGLLIEYAASNCKLFPLESITLLQMSIQSVKETWWLPEKENEEQILRTAIDSGDEDAKRIANEVINYRGDHGDFRWKHLLE